MTTSRQTALDWLLEQWPVLESQIPSRIIEQAREIEKRQIMEAVYDSMGTNFDPNMGRAELYYNKTYGGQDEN
jgi:hypothetical protein